MRTYEDILLLAAELVAAADMYAEEKDDIMALCLTAGELRGLVWAGEPVNSQRMADALADADFRKSMYPLLAGIEVW